MGWCVVNKLNLNNIKSYINFILSESLKEGDVAIDATLGNGHDSVKILDRIGSKGILYGFDIQEKALENTRRRISQYTSWNNQRFYLDSHEYMNKYVQEEVDLIIYNLGYLPGESKIITTRVQSTISSVKIGMQLLKPKGVILISLYPGHNEGIKERKSLLELLETVPQQDFSVSYLRFINQRNYPPELIIIQKQEN